MAHHLKRLKSGSIREFEIEKKQVFIGYDYPIGCHRAEFAGKKGFNFVLVAPHATKAWLCLFDEHSHETRYSMFRQQDCFTLFVVDVDVGQKYGFRLEGDTGLPYCYNVTKLLIDPYSRAVEDLPSLFTFDQLKLFHWNNQENNAWLAPKSVITEDDFDWQDDQAPRTPWSQTIIYELHVKGFSKLNNAISVASRGTFSGLADESSLAYLRNLGVTAVELLPIMLHLDEPHLQQKHKRNYWGYNVLAHFAPDQRLSSIKAVSLELKSVVRALHRMGIEVILDVVFNHTAENDISGPTLCQRGIDNYLYYWHHQQQYENWTGCGNSLNLSEPRVLQWVMDCLRYWVKEFHIDGFRFDLAAVLGRTPQFNAKAAFFTALQQDPVLANCKLIAEPWDIGSGGYQLGSFPDFFAEWNDRFRGDIRRFWLRDSQQLGVLAQRFAGSADTFQHQYRSPHCSINFVTAHDGFNLQDLVSYNEKHNWDNGEDNRDGDNHNFSFNHGVEGETDDIDIKQQRIFSKKALLATELLALGTPMLLAGDEIGHSQQGNNNCYCQDNELTWLNWQETDTELQQYVVDLIALRKEMAITGIYDDWWNTENAQWFTPRGEPMQTQDWQQGRALALLLQGKYLLLFNANRGEQIFQLPAGIWQKRFGEGLRIEQSQAIVAHLGVVILMQSLIEKR
ncbi:glycogen debranching protein GlgX [Gallibacterium genomosp. 1]|uniref:glycogen debranching protein GlgX n=1 Tax=Gallibacterium genomosp. 1 TaxID=155515 RepID=UPI000802726C|nr:glycogen debranching protein GlgX [Gallibacterium genomosp. 1]OBW98792.1 glycogen debranching protein [Gallibacterium genomosp. 1]